MSTRQSLRDLHIVVDSKCLYCYGTGLSLVNTYDSTFGKVTVTVKVCKCVVVNHKGAW